MKRPNMGVKTSLYAVLLRLAIVVFDIVTSND